VPDRTAAEIPRKNNTTKTIFVVDIFCVQKGPISSPLLAYFFLAVFFFAAFFAGAFFLAAMVILTPLHAFLCN
jgi:hypothetical protein